MLQVQSFAFNPFSENTYLIYNDQKNAILIDPGNFSEAETEQLEAFIKNKELTVGQIILTHAHIDHVLGLQWAADTFKVPVQLHDLETEILQRNPMDAQRFGFFFKPFSGETKTLQEGDVITLDDDRLHIYHVPGHSPGSIALHHEGQNFIISGDVLFQGSIGRTDLYKGSHEQLLQSIREKLFVLPEETVVYNGHGNPTTVGFEKQHNPFF
ncbi:MBL fold metallo-hydrolase [Chryseobacterium salipaludis]|uniref:MBL fold metallo-hydrolase n=1 Tax=Chryseobacterium TaxID=59732 RepID=UPI001FF46CAF|nr:MULTISPECIES: MBL fold metallo-hydrolase [Chryseobacterium]MCJ8498657.1 MBL fold metallo-hydrolase [Chryseobacterium salipaludis]MCX3297693.1 MBL fold metallo-hydrolase [Planobacterium sp. JC490]